MRQPKPSRCAIDLPLQTNKIKTLVKRGGGWARCSGIVIVAPDWQGSLMLIVESCSSKLTKRYYVIAGILMFLFFHFGALTMHIHYNPGQKKKTG